MTDEQRGLRPAVVMRQPYIIMLVLDKDGGRIETPAGQRDGHASADRFRKEMIGRHAADLSFVTAYLLPGKESAGTIDLVVSRTLTQASRTGSQEVAPIGTNSRQVIGKLWCGSGR